MYNILLVELHAKKSYFEAYLAYLVVLDKNYSAGQSKTVKKVQ